MRALAFILALVAAGFTLFQTGLAIVLMEMDWDFDLEMLSFFKVMDCNTKVILGSALLGVLGALFTAFKKKLGTLLLIAALVAMILVEIKAPFMYSWACVAFYAIAAMWSAAGGSLPQDDEAVSWRDRHLADDEQYDYEEDEAVEEQEEPEESDEEVVMAEEVAAPVAEESLQEIQEPEAFQESEEAAEAVYPVDSVDPAEVLDSAESEEYEEAEEAPAPLSAPAPVAPRKEESPLGTVMVMIVALAIGVGMTSAYYKNVLEQRSKSALSADPMYQQMVEDLKAKESLLAGHEESLKKAGADAALQAEDAAAMKKEVERLKQYGADRDSQIETLKASVETYKAQTADLKGQVAALEKSIAEQASKKYAFVHVANTRVRSKPSTAKDSQVITRLTNVVVEVIKSERPEGATAYWYYVKGSFGEGWIFGKNLQLQR